MLQTLGTLRDGREVNETQTLRDCISAFRKSSNIPHGWITISRHNKPSCICFIKDWKERTKNINSTGNFPSLKQYIIHEECFIWLPNTEKFLGKLGRELCILTIFNKQRSVTSFFFFSSRVINEFENTSVQLFNCHYFMMAVAELDKTWKALFKDGKTCQNLFQ